MPRCMCGWCEAIREEDKKLRPWWRRAFSFWPNEKAIENAVDKFHS